LGGDGGIEGVTAARGLLLLEVLEEVEEFDRPCCPLLLGTVLLNDEGGAFADELPPPA